MVRGTGRLSDHPPNIRERYGSSLMGASPRASEGPSNPARDGRRAIIAGRYNRASLGGRKERLSDKKPRERFVRARASRAGHCQWPEHGETCRRT